MSATVQIPTPLRPLTGGAADVSVAGSTVREVLTAVVTSHPDLRPKVFDGDKLRPFLNVYVNDEDIRYLDDLDTPVPAGAVVALIPAVAGG